MKKKSFLRCLACRIGLKSFCTLLIFGVFSFAANASHYNSSIDDEGFTSIQQKRKITGKVTDDTGFPLPGVSVIVKGSSIGTITSVNGNFEIDVPIDSKTLLLSFLGMESIELDLQEENYFEVKMKSNSIGLNELVVVGYGTQKKATLTGAIETVSSDVFSDKSTVNPALALQGQSPGLVVTRKSSRPGNEGLDFQIRGATSVNGGEPLIVIDGVPTINNESFYNLNSEDIEAVSILKDGAASIYGSRAANGVILVTTKKGKGDMTIEVSSSIQINTIGIRPPSPTMEEYATVWLEAADQDGDNANYWGWATRENLENMQNGVEGIYATRYWGDVFMANDPRFDELFGTSVSNQQNVSLSGSTDKSRYRFSAGYAENVGALKTAYDGKKQYNVRFNYDYDISDWLSLETGVSYFNSHVSSPSTGLGTESGVYDPPVFPAKNPYGQWYANFNIAGNRNAIASTVDGGRKDIRRDQIRLKFAATLKLTENLNLKGVASIDKDFYDYETYKVTVPQYTWFGELSPESVNPNSIYDKRKETQFYKNLGAFLNYKAQLGDHKLSAMIGITGEFSEKDKLRGQRSGFEDNGVYNLNLASQEKLVENWGGASNWGLYGFLGRFNYNYKDKYLIELIGRRDGSSKFDDGYKYSNFGGVSLGWIITEESFMKSMDFIDYLKVRAGYGEVGNQVGIGDHDYLSTMSYGTTLFGKDPSYNETARINGLTSNQRSWERVGISSLGVDFKLFDNKLYGSFDVYQKRNKDMLVQVKYPKVLGGTAPKSNSGELKTEGWEIMIGHKGSIGDFQYTVSANMSDSRNELIKMEGADSWKAGRVGTREGYALNSWFLYQTDGLFASNEDVNAYYNKYTSKYQGDVPSGGSSETRLRAGDTKRIDMDGNGYISDVGNGEDDRGDVVYMGDNSPHYVYGLNLSLKWRNFDFSTFFQGVLDHKIQRSGYFAYPFKEIWTNQTAAYIGKTWTPEQTNSKYPRMTANETRAEWNWKNNDFSLQNNRYIRCKNLVLGYTLRDLKLGNYKLDKLRVFFSGNDLFEFTSVKDGYDPEQGESSNSTYPFTRTYSFGVNLRF